MDRRGTWTHFDDEYKTELLSSHRTDPRGTNTDLPARLKEDASSHLSRDLEIGHTGSEFELDSDHPISQQTVQTALTQVDLWTPTSEQKAYYLSQFLRLKPEPSAKLEGSLAKKFFDLSALPPNELSDIWELADTDRDGMLTLKEFYIAMHLVVLRRNGFPIPPSLPVALSSVVTDALPSLEKNPVSDSPELVPGLSSSFGRVSLRQRRWSISSQSDVPSFDNKPNADSELLRPAAIRARTLPLNYIHADAIETPNPETLEPFISPPPPPPRTRIPVLHDTSTSLPESRRTQPTDPTPRGCFIENRPPDDDATPVTDDPVIAKLRGECNAVMKANEQLAVELTGLQQKRICLQLLLDHLLPFKTETACTSTH